MKSRKEEIRRGRSRGDKVHAEKWGQIADTLRQVETGLLQVHDLNSLEFVLQIFHPLMDEIGNETTALQAAIERTERVRVLLEKLEDKLMKVVMPASVVGGLATMIGVYLVSIPGFIAGMGLGFGSLISIQEVSRRVSWLIHRRNDLTIQLNLVKMLFDEYGKILEKIEQKATKLKESAAAEGTSSGGVLGENADRKPKLKH